MPKHNLICNTLNRYRRQGRPSHVEYLNFIINHDHIPEGFLRGDVRIDDSRHLIFMSEYQMHVLKSAKTWYMDGTFRVIRRPFTQLYGIHAFVSSGECKKQIIVAHVFMSRRTAADYEGVFRSIKSTVGDVAVERMVGDFEKAAWMAIQLVFETVSLKGCLFHVSQVI